MIQQTVNTHLIDPSLILKEGDIKEGDTVADFGCGAVGHFIFPAARLVGADGRVFAVDIQKNVLSSIQSRARLDNLHNVDPLWADIERPNGVRVADQTFDLVLVVNNLFMVKHADDLAEETRRTCKIDGTVVVADWSQVASPLGPAPRERVSPAMAESLFVKHGFSLDHAFVPGPYHWGLVFRRTS